MPYFEKRRGVLSVVTLLVVSFVPAYPSGAQTLKAVKERGTLNCGVSQGLPGFSSMDEKNTWTGFDVDFCRAVAAAIFGDPFKVTFMPLDTASRFTALQSNTIDVLSRNSTWTMSRESSLGLMFAGVAYYDGQGFLVRRDAEDRHGTGARRQDGLHPDRHHDRAKSVGLFPGQRHGSQGFGACHRG